MNTYMILQVLRHSLEENSHQRIFLIDSLDAATLGLVAYFVCIFFSFMSWGF